MSCAILLSIAALGSVGSGAETRELVFDAGMPFPASLQKTPLSVSDLQFSSDGKYILAAVVLTTESPAKEGRILVWSRPGSKLVADIPVSPPSTPSMCRSVSYLPVGEKLVYLDREWNQVKCVSLKDPTGDPVMAKIRPELTGFHAWAVWPGDTADGVLVFACFTDVDTVRTDLLDIPLHAGRKQQIVFREKIPDLHFAEYLAPLKAVLVSWKVTDSKHGIGIRPLAGKRTDLTLHYVSSPATAALPVGGDKSVLIGCAAGDLYRLDLATMKFDYEVNVANYSIRNIVVVDQSRCLLGTHDKHSALVVIDPRQGTVTHRYAISDAVADRAMFSQLCCRVSGDQVYFAAATSSRVLAGSMKIPLLAGR